jgi:hypothetical protein
MDGMTTPPPRIQPGTPAGGRFAARQRDADEITLINRTHNRDWFGADPTWDDPTAKDVVDSMMKVDFTNLLHRVEADEIPHARAAAHFWEHVGSDCNVPVAASRTVDWGAAREASLLVNAAESGGAGAVAIEYLRTGRRTAVVEALALPFAFREARVEDHRVVRIATVLADRPTIAAALWDALLDYATIEW